MPIDHLLHNYLTQTKPLYVWTFAATVVAAAAVFGLIRHYRPAWRYAAYSVLLVVVARAFLFGQSLSWEFYKDRLSVDDIGWRQQSAVVMEYYKFFRPTRQLKYLAVGSSQTFAIYEGYSRDHRDVVLFELAGMTPLDMYLYRQEIASRRPEIILLYLSEFDLAKEPSLVAAKSAPAQGLSLLQVLPALSDIARQTQQRVAFNEILAGEFFPEYKYAFIFKGLTEKLSGRNAALARETLYKQLSPTDEQLQRDIEDLLRNMDWRWIRYQEDFLDRFLDYCSRRSLKVIIVEGQYHPSAYTPKSRQLYTQVHALLEQMTRRFNNVSLVPRDQVPAFSAGDYKDSVHVKEEAGYRFAQQVLGQLP